MNNGNNEDQNKIRRKKVSSSNNTNKPNNSSTENNSRTKSRKKNNKKDKFRFFRLTGVFILALLVVVAAVGTGLVFSSLKDVQPVTKALLDEKTYQTTKIYYANGDLLSNAPSVNKKEPVSLDDMSPHLKNAIVAIEDERFYEHNGVDIVGLARSAVKTLLGKTQGGSTIPMQVSKMLLTSSEQTLPRKVKDIYYAYEMSKTLSKEEILEAYLNNFSVGRGLIGAEAGAQGYFSKKAIDLELEEAALLAGSTKNPSAYKAYNADKLDGTETKEDLENKILLYTHTADDDWDDSTDIDLNMLPKLVSWKLIDSDTADQIRAGTLIIRKAVLNPKAKARQEVVLGKMLELGYITQEEHDKAVAAKIEIKLPKVEDPVVSSVQDLIESEVVKALMNQGHTWDEADNLFRNGGLHIQTTIDSSMQDVLEEEYEDNSNFPQTRDNGTGVVQPQSAMVILDYRTGQIKALVGGRHIKGRKTLNRATTAQQPGSTIKPLSVYTPAIDTLEITQADSLSDARGGYEFSQNAKWNPSTTTAGSGYMSLRKALAYSSNTIAVKTAEMLGDSYEECVDVMLDYLKNFGISTLKDSKTGDINEGDRRFPALTLGGMTYGVSPLEMASAYGTLANGGVYIEPTIFSTIKTYDGTLLVKASPQENRVVSSEVAFVITDMLKAVVTEGIGGTASIGGKIDVAGKTGTTNGKLDAWFVGYTPYYVASTYIGDDAGRKDPNTQKTIPRQGVVGSSGSAAKLWSTVMKRVHANLTEAHFTAPDNVYFAKINLIDGGISSTGSSAAFINGTAPRRVSSQQVVKPPKEEEAPEETPDNNDTSSDPPDNDNSNSDNNNNSDNNSNNNSNNGGGTVTPPDNSGGETTTPPDNSGGGTTTPPDNSGGGTATPPVEEPTE
ncbi:penicillin-binding protein [Romboutsia ilealis]|uniref:Penicillin-binding protein 1A n=1 Tax=Romboutsia faecis TaxID=2764597 RepID=A0ABR7JRL3_9FIRM|nr:transglycosylase domain-containing protein [Romboutsia faecis]MBC5997529.1 transglycosylase domain-containing protein [Romboutsia faecis]MRN24838.1 penicillin-binding protein [Romboutsia ilealis]